MTASVINDDIIGGGTLFFIAAFSWFFGRIINGLQSLLDADSPIYIRGKKQFGLSFDEQIHIAIVAMIFAGLIMEANRAWGWRTCEGFFTLLIVALTAAAISAGIYFVLFREIGRGAIMPPIGLIFGALFASGLTHQVICLSN